MPILLIPLLSLFWLAIVGCNNSVDAPPGPDESRSQRPPKTLYGTVTARELEAAVHGEDFTALVDGNATFALDMLKLLREANPDDNLALGPYSISQALAMLYAGARGETAAKMKQALHFAGNLDAFHVTFNGLDLELLSRNPDVLLRNANRVWVDEGYRPKAAYLDELTAHYGAPMAVLDFRGDPEGSRATINNWVAEVTEQKILELFPAGTIEPHTVLSLTNAMYMDAPWKYPFDPKQTGLRPFRLMDGSTVDVEMMHYHEFLPSAGGDGWRAVEIPYRGDELAMLVIVPDNLGLFEIGFGLERLREIQGEIRDGGIHLSMPRFTYRFHTSLVDPLRALGLGSLFDGPDLSGIGPGGLFVSAAEHEAFIEVDEEGTRAAAATGLAIALSHGPTVSVDRPFLFFILDKPTGSILFLGRVLDPRPGQ